MTYGIRTVWSKLVKGTKPVVNNVPVEFEVWLTPTMVHWDHMPIDRDGPYRLVRAACEGQAVFGYAESPHFLGLMTEFATVHMPRRDEVCAILDRHCTIVIGWITRNGMIEWQGCEYAFDMLAMHHPISVPFWAEQARKTADEQLINLEEWAWTQTT